MKYCGLTPRQHRFALRIALLTPYAVALRECYPRSRRWKPKAVWTRASALANLPAVRSFVAELRRRACEPLDAPQPPGTPNIFGRVEDAQGGAESGKVFGRVEDGGEEAKKPDAPALDVPAPDADAHEDHPSAPPSTPAPDEREVRLVRMLEAVEAAPASSRREARVLALWRPECLSPGDADEVADRWAAKHGGIGRF